MRKPRNLKQALEMGWRVIKAVNYHGQIEVVVQTRIGYGIEFGRTSFWYTQKYIDREYPNIIY